MRAECLFSGIRYELIKGSLDADICDIVDDSRQVSSNAVFVCRRGAVTNGRKYIGDAISRGAAGIIITDEVWDSEDVYDADIMSGSLGYYPDDFFVVVMHDKRYSIGRLCNNFWGYPSRELTVIGVTGTKGKTTVTYMMKKVLETCGCKTGLIGTIEVDDCSSQVQSVNTTPGVVQLHRILHNMVSNGARCCVMEVSSQGIMLGRVSGVDFDIGIFTNISPDHIGKNEHKTFEEYIRWKSTMFSMCRYAVINMDDVYAPCICNGIQVNGAKKCSGVIGYGMNIWSKELYDKISEHMPVYDIHFSLYIGDQLAMAYNGITPGTECECVMPDGDRVPIHIDMPGLFNVYNALAVIAAGDVLGFPRSTVSKALEDICVRGRMECAAVYRGAYVYIDYAHNPVSLENVLKTLRSYFGGKIFCVFGCGGNRAKSRRIGMGMVSGKMADLTIVTNDNPRFEDPEAIMDDIEDGLNAAGAEYIRIPDRKKAIRYGIVHAVAGDVVLLAGKGHETYQDVMGHRTHMDERELIGQILEEEDAGVICGRDN